MMSSSGISGEVWAYMRERKKWWLAPVIMVMLLVGALLIFAQGSALAPFIYTIF
jgi:drug/metabolite transporter superfamily protein YnfA